MGHEASARKIIDAFVKFAYGRGYSNENKICLRAYALPSQASLNCDGKNYFLQNSSWDIYIDDNFILSFFVYLFPTTNEGNPYPCNTAPSFCPGGGGCGTCESMANAPPGTGFLCPSCLLEEQDLDCECPVDGINYNFRDPEQPLRYSHICKPANSPYIPDPDPPTPEDFYFNCEIACQLTYMDAMSSTQPILKDVFDGILSAICCNKFRIPRVFATFTDYIVTKAVRVWFIYPEIPGCESVSCEYWDFTIVSSFTDDVINFNQNLDILSDMCSDSIMGAIQGYGGNIDNQFSSVEASTDFYIKIDKSGTLRVFSPKKEEAE